MTRIREDGHVSPTGSRSFTFVGDDGSMYRVTTITTIERLEGEDAEKAIIEERNGS
jgi:hypothetical protein